MSQQVNSIHDEGVTAEMRQRLGALYWGLYNVRDFGAVGDGKTNDTQAVQAAIDRCSQTGGRLVFPPGEYRTGMVRLRSHVTADLCNGAVWRAIPDLALYPAIPMSNMPAFLFAEDEEDIHFTGEGRIHGSGDAHDVFVPASDRLKKGPRPFGLLLRRCKNISLTGVTLESSAYWMLRAVDCDDLIVRRIRIFNGANFNNDGIDIVDCHRVVISDCILDCEDDAICPKSESERGVEDLVVTNCVISSHANAIKFGWAGRGAFRRIAISNCVIKPSQFRTTCHPAGLVDGIAGITLGCADGGELTNVSFTNIVMDGVMTPLFVRLGERNSRRQATNDEHPVPPRASVVDGLTFSNIRAVNAGNVACSISGYPGHYIRNVRLSSIDLAFRIAGALSDMDEGIPENSKGNPGSLMFGRNLPAYGLFLRHVREVIIDGLRLQPAKDEPRYELVADDAHGLEIRGFHTGRSERDIPKLKITNSSRVHWDGNHTTPQS